MKMPIQTMRLKDIVPAEYNPRQNLQKGDYQYDRLHDSVERFGFIIPLVVNTRNNTLISGHQRYKVLAEMGVEEVEVIAVNLDDEREKMLNIAMNRIESDWDYEKLNELLKEYSEDDLFATGFTKQEIESVFAQAEECDFDKESEEADEQQYYGGAEETAGEGGAEELFKKADEPCTIYLSFGSKKAAEGWLKGQGIDKAFERSQTIIVRMEGTEYGTASN